jgi:XTP/dITP diphosphohydrolase
MWGSVLRSARFCRFRRDRCPIFLFAPVKIFVVTPPWPCEFRCMTTLVIATRNAHKVREVRTLLPALLKCLTLMDFPGAPDVAEDATTFAGNAGKKAAELARWLSAGDFRSQIPHDGSFAVLADDSGLEVDALNGAPGVYSARFAALDSKRRGNSPDPDNNAKLLRLLANVPVEKRTARFRCVLALAADGEAASQLFDGVCEGHIVGEQRGENGFGYDPLFVPAGFNQTFAELDEASKNRISHRAKALAKLRGYWRAYDETGSRTIDPWNQ